MIGRMIFVVSLLTCLVPTSAFSRPQGPPPDVSHDAWVLVTLKQMASIKAGMTEADLLQVFKPQRGEMYFANGRPHIHVAGITASETFISRACPYFKVDVEFVDVAPFDVIAKISRPYVEFPLGIID
jgi:hypothetical protein